MLLASGDEIGPEAILLQGGATGARARRWRGAAALVGRTVADVERDLILDTLQHTLGNRTHAATILGISIRTLRNKLRQYGDEGVPVPPPGGGPGDPVGARGLSVARPPDRPWRTPRASPPAGCSAASAGTLRHGDLALALGVIGILVVLILPMPRLLLDLLLARLDHLLGAGAADLAVHRAAARVQRLSRRCC